jgi:hypothetical protein
MVYGRGINYLLLEACLDLDDLALQLMDLCTDSTRDTGEKGASLLGG